MALIIAIANSKGGCGKTTTTINLAGGLTAAQYRVLVVDADPQASALLWSVARGQGTLPFDVVTIRSPGLNGRFSGLAALDYDIILVDCPPGLIEAKDDASKFARSAIADSDAIIVPIRPSTLDFSAAATFVRFLLQAKPAETKTAVLINAKQNTLLGRQARSQAQVLFAPVSGAVVLETTIGHRAPIVEVSGSGRTIFDYARPGHEAVHEYLNLTKEIIQWLTANAPFSPLMTSQTSHPSTLPSQEAVDALQSPTTPQKHLM